MFVDIETYRQKRDVVCPLCEREKAMALRKKPNVNREEEIDPKSGDVAKMKKEMADGAAAVEKAAKNLTVPIDFGKSPLEAEWSSVRDTVSQLDREFADVEVRVMQVGPDGRLTDVSDKVSPRDIMPEQIERFDSSDGSVRLPRRMNGEIDHDAALDLMGRLIGVSRFPGKETSPTSAAACKEMETLLAETDKTLKKLRR
jgi:hypothetical protein